MSLNKERKITLRKILVIEDQSGPLENLSLAIREAVLGESLENRFSDYPQRELEEREVDVARCYLEAERAIETRGYDMVFLDHRLPYENQVELERKDFDAFCNTLDGRGYNLIPRIRERNPYTVIIGTSSLHGDELRLFEKPDYKLDKCGNDVSGELRKILTEMKGEQEK